MNTNTVRLVMMAAILAVTTFFIGGVAAEPVHVANFNHSHNYHHIYNHHHYPSHVLLLK